MRFYWEHKSMQNGGYFGVFDKNQVHREDFASPNQTGKPS